MDLTEPVKGLGGGATSSPILYPRSGSKLYVANTADSASIVALFDATTNRSTIVARIRRDKPHLPLEREWIDVVEIEESSRLLVDLSDGTAMGLGMSRRCGGEAGGPRF